MLDSIFGHHQIFGVSKIELNPTNEEEVLRLMKHIGQSNGAGYDEVPCHLLSDCAQYIVVPLTAIINHSDFTTGKFPKRIRVSKIVPINKKNDTKSASNYRSIVVQSIFSKILKTIFYVRTSLDSV